MKKGCFIVPYFGKFPDIFPLFLSSVEKNTDYDWLIFTDNDYSGKIPNNVQYIQIGFSEIREIIQSKFQFEIYLNEPYKLCDYKCAYGYIFQNYLAAYSHWGYCDIDLIFGYIDHFISNEMLEKYDKIGHMGHFSLYKNEEKMNTLFMHNDYFREVFTSRRIYVFDEWDERSINRILLDHNYSLCFLNSWTDIYPHNSFLNKVDCVFDDKMHVSYRTDNRIHFFEWNDGLLYDYLWHRGRTQSKEIMYVHLQKRKMVVSDKEGSDKLSHIYCIPNRIINAGDRHVEKILLSFMWKIIDVKWIRFWSRKLIYTLKERLYLVLKGN